MTAMGILVLTLIGDSQHGKQLARVNGLATAATSVYEQSSRQASYDARTIARQLESVGDKQLGPRVAKLAQQVGIVRLTIKNGTQVVADYGDVSAVAPGLAIVQHASGASNRSITVSEVTAAQFAGQLSGHGVGVVVQQGGRTLGSSLPAAAGHTLPHSGSIELGGRSYEVARLAFSGFGAAPVDVTVLSDNSVTGGSLGAERLVALVLILFFVFLAFCFTMIVSHAFHGQLSRFLEAARRLGSGDFTSPDSDHGRTSSRRSARSSTRCRCSSPTGWTSSSASRTGFVRRSAGSARLLPPTSIARRCSSSR